MNIETTESGITYRLPEVALLASTPLASSEIGARICYDSFDKAKDPKISSYKFETGISHDINSSELVETLSHVYHHESVAEHTVVTFHIHDMSRGVLQSLTRHRIASYSVRSARHTMNSLLIRGLVYLATNDRDAFINYVIGNKILIIEESMALIEAGQMFDKLSHHDHMYGGDFFRLILSDEQIEYYESVETIRMNNQADVIKELELIKGKSRAGDVFKYLISENWSTELIMTINLRSLKNFIKVRMSEHAHFQIRYLATAIYDLLPDAYKRVVKKSKTVKDTI